MEKRMGIEVGIQIRTGSVDLFFGNDPECGQVVIRGIGKKQIVGFDKGVFFIGRQRLFGFRSFGKLFHQVTFSVTAHYQIVFIDTQFVCDIIIIENVLKNRDYRFKQHRKSQ
jgi:hypothetical protein